MSRFFKKFSLFSTAPDEPRVEASNLGVSLISAHAEVTNFEWREVVQIDAFKRDLVTFDEVVFEFRLKSPDRVIQISENLSEFKYLVRFLETQWPKIPKDWREKVIQPPFAENRTTLFRTQF